MATVNLSEQTFNDTVTADGIVLVDWWASWCGPCRMFAPIYEAASEQHPDVAFGKVDTEAEQRLARAGQIMSIPITSVAVKANIPAKRPVRSRRRGSMRADCQVRRDSAPGRRSVTAPPGAVLPRPIIRWRRGLT